MAIQGKGIFGGFSGKVGNIVGYRRNGKDIMQRTPKFKSRVLGFAFNSALIDLVDATNVTLIPNGLTKVGSPPQWTTGASFPWVNRPNILSATMVNNVSTSNIFFMVTKDFISKHIVSQEYVWRIQAGFMRVSVHRDFVFTEVQPVLGTKFRIEMSKNFVWFKYLVPGEKWVTAFQAVNTLTGAYRMVISIGNGNANVIDCEAGYDHPIV